MDSPESLDDNGAYTLATTITICSRIKGVTLAVWREHAERREELEAIRCQQQVASANDGHVGFSGTQAKYGLM